MSKRAWRKFPSPEERRPMYQILRAPQQGTIRCLILSNHLANIVTHWIDSRTVGCLGDNCPCKDLNWRGHWRSYCHVLALGDKRQYLLELPPGAVQQAELWVIDLTERGIRGVVLEVFRSSIPPRGKVLCEMRPVREEPKSMEAYPPGCHVEQELERIWTSKLQ